MHITKLSEINKFKSNITCNNCNCEFDIYLTDIFKYNSYSMCICPMCYHKNYAPSFIGGVKFGFLTFEEWLKVKAGFM